MLHCPLKYALDGDIKLFKLNLVILFFQNKSTLISKMKHILSKHNKNGSRA